MSSKVVLLPEATYNRLMNVNSRPKLNIMSRDALLKQRRVENLDDMNEAAFGTTNLDARLKEYDRLLSDTMRLQQQARTAEERPIIAKVTNGLGNNVQQPSGTTPPTSSTELSYGSAISSVQGSPALTSDNETDNRIENALRRAVMTLPMTYRKKAREIAAFMREHPDLDVGPDGSIRARGGEYEDTLTSVLHALSKPKSKYERDFVPTAGMISRLMVSEGLPPTIVRNTLYRVTPPAAVDESGVQYYYDYEEKTSTPSRKKKRRVSRELKPPPATWHSY